MLEEVKKDLDIDIDVLEQVEEAFLGNVGIRSEIKVDSGISVDIGGASTEVVYFEEDGPREYINLKTGSLLLFGENVSRILPKKSEIRAIEKSVIRELNSSHFSSKENKLIGIGGTIRTTGKVIADLWNEDEKKFTLKDIYKLLNLIKDRNTETIRSIIRTNPARIHTIIPGIIILKILMEKLGIDEIEVSDNGLREGYLIYKVLEGNNGILFSK